jgi:transcription elongation factor GreA
VAGLPDESVVLPFANLQAPDGRRKPHGLKSALLDDQPSGPVTAAQRRAAAGRPAVKPSQGVRRSDRVLSSRTPAKAPARRATRAVPVAGPDAPRPPTRVTAGGLAAMQAEHLQLTTISRPAIVARIKSARELGDLRENSEYQEARREQSFAEGRIQALEELLRNVEIIDEVAARQRIDLGSTVVVDDGTAEATFHIVGPTESDPRSGRISARSPIGAALIGHGAGDEVVIETPGGATRYRVVSLG